MFHLMFICAPLVEFIYYIASYEEEEEDGIE